MRVTISTRRGVVVVERPGEVAILPLEPFDGRCTARYTDPPIIGRCKKGSVWPTEYCWDHLKMLSAQALYTHARTRARIGP